MTVDKNMLFEGYFDLPTDHPSRVAALLTQWLDDDAMTSAHARAKVMQRLSYFSRMPQVSALAPNATDLSDLRGHLLRDDVVADVFFLLHHPNAAEDHAALAEAHQADKQAWKDASLARIEQSTTPKEFLQALAAYHLRPSIADLSGFLRQQNGRQEEFSHARYRAMVGEGARSGYFSKKLADDITAVTPEALRPHWEKMVSDSLLQCQQNKVDASEQVGVVLQTTSKATERLLAQIALRNVEGGRKSFFDQLSILTVRFGLKPDSVLQQVTGLDPEGFSMLRRSTWTAPEWITPEQRDAAIELLRVAAEKVNPQLWDSTMMLLPDEKHTVRGVETGLRRLYDYGSAFDTPDAMWSSPQKAVQRA